MEVYNENQLNSEESELSIEDAMKVNGTTNIPDVNLEDIEDDIEDKPQLEARVVSKRISELVRKF